jgi:hypothetical protein
VIYRVRDLKHIFSSLPEPERLNQIHNVLVPKDLIDYKAYQDINKTEEEAHKITLRAERFAQGNNRWLEWVIDI